MIDMLNELASSKKAMVTLAGVVASVLLHVAAHYNLALTTEDASALSLKITGMVSAYVLGQGLADHGVEAAQVTADAQTTTAAAGPQIVVTKTQG